MKIRTDIGMNNDKRTPVWPRDYDKDDKQQGMEQVCGVIAGVSQGEERDKNEETKEPFAMSRLKLADM